MSDPDSKSTPELASFSVSELQTEILNQARSLASYSQVEELERNLQASLALIGTLKNASRPVNSLPPAVLGRVFGLIQEIQDDNFSYEDAPPNRWILVTHVCRHWRSVAHKTPSLWSQIHVHGKPRHVQYFLEKSFPHPLTVYCGSLVANLKHSDATFIRTEIVTHALRSISAHMNRVQELYFSSRFPVDAVLQRDQYSRIVVASISSSLPSKGRKSPTRSVDIFAEFFSLSTSSMRKLSLHGLPITYMMDSAIQHHSLTHLALYEQPRWSDSPPNFLSKLDAFLDILQATSRSLQSLTLVRAGPAGDMSRDPASQTDITRRRTVGLPALMSLEIGDWITSGNIAHFLAHLIIPGQAKRCIWGDNFKYLSSILFSVDPDTAQTKGRGWDSEIKRVVFTTVNGKDMIGIHNNAVYIQGRLDFLTVYPLFRDQPHIFQRVEELVFTSTTSPAALTTEEYRLLFMVLPNVQRLVMVDMDISSILQALGLFSQDAEPPLPELRDITIQYSAPSGLGVMPPTRDPLGNEYKISPLSVVLALAKLSQQRAKLECPFEHLKFDFGVRRMTGDAVGDYLEIFEHLKRWVENVELVVFDSFRDLVSDLLDGMWPSRASLGQF